MEIHGPSSPLGIALALLIGLGSVGYGAYSYSVQSTSVDSAVETNATVESTSVETVDQRRGVAYAPRATFTYTFEGERYTSSNVYPGPLSRTFDTESEARAQVEAYEPDETVTAYVPSEHPDRAFLNRTRSNKPFLLVGVGALFVVVSVRSALS